MTVCLKASYIYITLHCVTAGRGIRCPKRLKRCVGHHPVADATRREADEGIEPCRPPIVVLTSRVNTLTLKDAHVILSAAGRGNRGVLPA